jgi:hypothetical protein
VPVRLLAAVVEIVPLFVVEIVPVLVVEMVPVFARAGAETARTNIAVQMVAFRFFMVLLLSIGHPTHGRLEVSACLAFFRRPANTFVSQWPLSKLMPKAKSPFICP